MIRLINIILFLDWFSPLEENQAFKNVGCWTFIPEDYIITYFACCLYYGYDVLKVKIWNFVTDKQLISLLTGTIFDKDYKHPLSVFLIPFFSVYFPPFKGEDH